jgi:hypothetical protein
VRCIGTGAWGLGIGKEPGSVTGGLAELGIRIGREAGADALVGRPECFATVLARIVVPVEMPRFVSCRAAETRSRTTR